MSEFDLLAYARNHSQEHELVRTIEVRPGAEVDLMFVGRQAYRELSRRLNRLKGPGEVKDAAAEAGIRRLLAKAIKDWRGFGPEVVAELIPVDPAGLPEELPCTERNKEALLLNSTEFSDLVSSGVSDLAAFRDERREAQEKN